MNFDDITAHATCRWLCCWVGGHHCIVVFVITDRSAICLCFFVSEDKKMQLMVVVFVVVRQPSEKKT